MSTAKKDPTTEKKLAKTRRLHRHADPVIHVESDEGTSGPAVEADSETAFHPARHHVGTSIGAVPEVPNLLPGGSVTIKR
jgi:hypothetical protein